MPSDFPGNHLPVQAQPIDDGPVANSRSIRKYSGIEIAAAIGRVAAAEMIRNRVSRRH
jgi:hypothetical protein